MSNITTSTPVFVFDVESVGLHGEGFAVGGGVYIGGNPEWEFLFSCPPDKAQGIMDDRRWIGQNVPPIDITHDTPAAVREAFWKEWVRAQEIYPGITMFGECIWPVEAAFVADCVRGNLAERRWRGPYPFHDIASFMAAAGMDPLDSYDRLDCELPCHHPLFDARQSARLLKKVLLLRSGVSENLRRPENQVLSSGKSGLSGGALAMIEADREFMEKNKQ